MSLGGWVGPLEVDGFRFGDAIEDVDASTLSDEQLLLRFHRAIERFIRLSADSLRDGWEMPSGTTAHLTQGLEWFPHLNNLLLGLGG